MVVAGCGDLRHIRANNGSIWSLEMKNNEAVVVAFIEGTLAVPAHLLPLVQEYRRLAEVTKLDAYPRSVDETMNKIYDVLEVVV